MITAIAARIKGREHDGHPGLREDVWHYEEFIWKHFVSDSGNFCHLWSLELGYPMLLVWRQHAAERKDLDAEDDQLR